MKASCTDPAISPKGSIPGLVEWGQESDELDESYARRIFFGKSVEQTFPLFDRSAIDRASDLRYMPVACFPYYMLAYRDYLLLNSTLSSDMAPDAASCFIDLVLEKLERDPKVMLPLIPQVLPTLRHLAFHQNEYHADLDIYGDFKEKVMEIERSFEKAWEP